jgi:hypothetical protein
MRATRRTRLELHASPPLLSITQPVSGDRTLLIVVHFLTI